MFLVQRLVPASQHSWANAIRVSCFTSPHVPQASSQIGSRSCPPLNQSQQNCTSSYFVPLHPTNHNWLESRPPHLTKDPLCGIFRQEKAGAWPDLKSHPSFLWKRWESSRIATHNSNEQQWVAAGEYLKEHERTMLNWAGVHVCISVQLGYATPVHLASKHV